MMHPVCGYEVDSSLFAKNRHPLFLDVGACHGQWTVGMLTRFPGAACICIEPSPFALPSLIEHAGRRGARILTVAVAESDRLASLWCWGDTDASLLQWRDRPYCERIDVSAMSLHTIFSELKLDHCDVLKLDVEGMEEPVLRSWSIAPLPVNQIVAEIHDYRGAWRSAPGYLTAMGFDSAVTNRTPEGRKIRAWRHT